MGEDYIGVGFHIGTEVDVVAEALHLGIEPDEAEIKTHEEVDGDVVVIVFQDADRHAEASLVIDRPRWEQLVDDVEEALDG